MGTNKWQPVELAADEHEGFAERLKAFKREAMNQIMHSA
jgi:hypothetical protein